MSSAAPTSNNFIAIPPGSDLIETKLYARPARANLVDRPRITRLLDAGLPASLILVSAPAGFGKTTALVEWLRNQPQRSCWLSLDASDNDPARFWSYVIASLQSIRDELGETALAGLRSPQPPTLQVILPSLINEVEAFHDRGILVLDDYHVITSTAVHSSLTYFLENLPPGLHVIISTRSDPPIPIAKLRARGQLVEIRTDELRFTPEEATAFLNQTMQLELSAQQVAALHERAEGWIAGLQMAALSMHGRDDVDGFIRAFAGTHRFIMDYLLEEVLAREPEEVQAFLLKTAILTRLTGPLCDAVIGNHSAGTASSGSQEMLARLEKRNLFVVPLDDDRTWYRYHHLFADLLHAQLQKSHGQQEIAALHLRASAWHEQNGAALDAILHASLAADPERIEHLIERNYTDMINRGEMASVRFWMGKLSKEMVYRRPWLCLYEALSHSWFGQLEEADALLNVAEKHIQSYGTLPGIRTMSGYHSYVSSRVTAMKGDTARAIKLALAARDDMPGDNLGLQIEVGITLGYEYFLYGDFVNATNVLRETIRTSYAGRAINTPVAAYCLLARSLAVQGRLHDADEQYHKAAQLIRDQGGEYLGAVGLVEVGAAALLCEWNDTEAALVRVKHGLDYLPSWGKADDFCLAYVTLSRIQRARGDQAGAESALAKAAHFVQTCGVFSEARGVVETTQVRFWLAEQQWSLIDRWMTALETRSPDQLGYEEELAHITQARVLTALNKAEEAIRLLTRLEECARLAERRGRLIEISVLKALAMQQAGLSTRALAALGDALALAEPEGYVRVFVDEGSPMQVLLAQWLTHANESPLRDYAGRLLSQFDGAGPAHPRTQGQSSPTANLIEPLTPRELEVLRLICAGDSNQAIADRLFITPGAVKKHTGNILGKLGVASRAQAMVKARRLELIPEEN